MSGFQEHFLDKYFAYRRKYVDYVAAEVPKRARMAVFSEIARLSFSAFGSFLCGFVFAPLVFAAVDRHGYPAAVIFFVLALASMWFGVLSVRGLAIAWSDPRRLVK